MSRKILLTSTSFQDTPGKHQELLAAQDYEVTAMRGPLKATELLPIIAEFDAVICGDDEYTGEVLRKGKTGRLQCISKYGVGLDKIDLDAAARLGIPVSNCPGVNHTAVAEHVLALLLTYEKNIHIQYNTVKQATWRRLTGHEVSGKTLGIIGMGAIGKALAEKAIAFGLQVIGYDIKRDERFFAAHPQCQYVEDINNIFAQSDYISLHTPLNEQTRKIINKEVIEERIKKQAIIINTARGGLVDSTAIIEGIETGKIRAYLADVLEEEPICTDEVLLGANNVIITPHVGSRTYESVERQGIMAVENLIKLLSRSI